MSGTDRRVQYTKMFLREALLELLREKPIGKITPTELCRRADINRNTFYAHYESPEALLTSIENELMEKIGGALDAKLLAGDRRRLLTQICQAIHDNADLCRVILSERGDPGMLLRLIDLARDQALSEWRARGIAASEEDMELLYAYHAAGSVAIIRRWLAEGMRRSPAAIAELLDRVTLAGLTPFAGGAENKPAPGR